MPGGDRLELGGATFTAVDLGTGESPHDSVWLLGDDRPLASVRELVRGNRA